MDSGMVWTFGSLVLVLLFLMAIVWPLSAAVRARAGLRKEEEYRTLADRSIQVAERFERQSLVLQSSVAALDNRVKSLERMLAEVD